MATILVVDDELGIRALLSEILADEGHTVELAENAAQARQVREVLRPDLVLLDIWMPDVDGVTLLKEWSAANLLTMPVIMMSGHGTIDTAVEATKYGASAFLEKPITLQKLLRAVDAALIKPGSRGPTAGPAGAASGPPPLRGETVESLIASGAAGSATAGGGNLGGAFGVNAGVIPGANSGFGALPAAAAQLAAVGSGGHGVLAGGAGGPLAEQSFDLDRPLREARDAFEKSYFEFHLAKEAGSMTRVAEKTGLERTHLYRKLKQLGVDLTRNKRNGNG
jgi:DNA-binding NtrC family response regulator